MLAGTLPVAFAAACAATALRPRAVRSVAASRAAGRRRAPAPTTAGRADLLDRMAAELRSGRSLAAVRAEHAAELTGDATHPDQAVVLQAVRCASDLGGHTAAVLQSAAAVLRERAAIADEAAAHSAQARLSARVLTAVPLLFAGWSVATSASFRTALLSPAGSVAALAGCACSAVGGAWMRRLVRKAAR
jgi:hypothetical protein